MDWITAAKLAIEGTKAASNIAAARAQGRVHEANINVGRDSNANNTYATQQRAQTDAGQLDLQRQQFLEQARGNRARQATIADLLMGHTPTRVSVPGIRNASISGGLKLGEMGRASLGEMGRQALLAQAQPPEFTGGEMLRAPEQAPMPRGNAVDSILGNLGQWGSLAGVIAPYLQQSQGYRPPEVGLNAGLGGLPGEAMGIPEEPKYSALDPEWLSTARNRNPYADLFKGQG